MEIIDENVILFVSLGVYIAFFVFIFRYCTAWLGAKASGRGSIKRESEEYDIRYVTETELNTWGDEQLVTREESVAEIRHAKWVKFFVVIFFIIWIKFYLQVHSVLLVIIKPIVYLIMKLCSPECFDYIYSIIPE